ncbi:MAG: hypothetical protein RBT74_06745 [Tenuifilaceae bacterium]|jgi:hypothetical protein|nr:hypothetical protein [Tenuifilaceae bacterium]
MPFKKGDERINRDGRKRGKPNRTTEQLRQLVQSFIETNIEDIQDQYDLLEAKDKLLFLEKLLKVVLPPPIISLEQLSEEDIERLINKLRDDQKSQNTGT